MDIPVWISRLCEFPSEVTALIKESANLSRVFFNEKHRNFESTKNFYNRLRQLHVLETGVHDVEAFLKNVNSWQNFKLKHGSKNERQLTNTLWTLALAAKLDSASVLYSSCCHKELVKLLERQHPRSEVVRAALLCLELCKRHWEPYTGFTLKLETFRVPLARFAADTLSLKIFVLLKKLM